MTAVELWPDGDSQQAMLLAPRQRWNPWEELAEKHPHYRLTDTHDLGERTMGLCFMAARRIALNSRMNQSERRCTVAHELVHIERGPVPSDWPGWKRTSSTRSPAAG